ncbi:collagenase-like [Sabethes cyaneus]|uniref:collagenase-like n=1 Tax=Sabethes cyaneus TaxID=53552 RepID=UPI00237DAB33|nr:collagenase-like [Sabethes cyaneus]
MKRFAFIALLFTVGAQVLPDRTPYIINGHPAPHQPYNAYVQYLNAQNAGYFGGGSIISDRHILTAAHIINGFVRWDIGLGSNAFTQLSILTTNMAAAHPDFNVNTLDNDIGILTLAHPLIFSSAIAPITLPALQGQLQLPLENEEGAIHGFGFTTAASPIRSDFLMRSFQRVTSSNVCQQYYQVIIPNHFCAEDTVEQSNLCFGDLGAGFVTYVRGSPTLTGVASMIANDCASGTPTGYTRVGTYRQWIQQVTGV